LASDLVQVQSSAAPVPVGPYSQAIVHQGLVWCSGQIPLDPSEGKVVDGGIEAQAGQVLANLRSVLEAAGSSMQEVLRVGIYLTDLSLFPRLNAVYARHFPQSPQPARSTVGVAALPLGVLVEMDAVAALGRGPV